MTKRINIQVKDNREREKIKALAEALGMTVSNYFRTGRNLEPIKKAGAPLGNKNRATGKRKPKTDKPPKTEPTT